MKARRFLEQNLSFDPAQLITITRAFENAWAELETNYAGQEAREAGRMRLATIVMELAKQGDVDEKRIKVMATAVMRRPRS